MYKVTNHISFIILLTLSVANTSFAQTKIGFATGLTFSTGQIENDITNNNEARFTKGIRLGITIDIPLKGVFNLQSGIVYAQKGFKQEENWFSGPENGFKANVSYLEVPVIGLYKSTWGPGQLVIGVGPYIAYGLEGRWETEWEIGYLGTKDGAIVFDDGWSNIHEYVYGRPFDYGGNVLAGYDLWGHFSVQLLGQFGVNLQPESNGPQLGSVFKNRNYTVSLGYKF